MVLYVPFGHGLHDVWPSRSWYLPFTQGMHALVCRIVFRGASWPNNNCGRGGRGGSGGKEHGVRVTLIPYDDAVGGVLLAWIQYSQRTSLQKAVKKLSRGYTETNLLHSEASPHLELPGAAREAVVDVGIAEFETVAQAEARRGELGDALGAARARVPNPTVGGIRTQLAIRTEGSGPAVLAASECVGQRAGTCFNGGRACGRFVLFDHARDVRRIPHPSS